MMRIIWLAIFALMLASCTNQQTLCFDHDLAEDTRVPVKVTFDWTDCPGAAPANMNLYLIPADGRHYLRVSFKGCDGGLLYVPKGHYAAVALNPDCDNVKVINPERYETFCITMRAANETSPSAKEADPTEAVVCSAPGYLWTAWLNDLEITGDDITIKMQETFCRYSVEIKSLTNSNIVSSIQGVLHGNHRSLGFGGVTDGAANAALLFEMGKDASRYPGPRSAKATDTAAARFYGEFLTFGHCGLTRTHPPATDATDMTHSLTLYYKLGDGSTRSAQVDVTDQVLSQPTERCHIVIDSLELPSTGDPNITVEEWQTEFIDIPVNGGD